MGYNVIEGTNEIYRLCLEHELYLLKGKMLEGIYEQHTGEWPCKAIFYSPEGKDAYQAVCVLIPEGDGGNFVYTAMLYVKKSLRGTGIAQRLVTEALALANEWKTLWCPWDFASGIFFQRLIDNDVLTEANFTPYRLSLLADCHRLLASGLARPR